jgi:uncharacterized protein (DUF2237 family)
MLIVISREKNVIYPVEFPLCGTPLGGFHRAGFCHPKKDEGLFLK